MQVLLFMKDLLFFHIIQYKLKIEISIFFIFIKNMNMNILITNLRKRSERKKMTLKVQNGDI